MYLHLSLFFPFFLCSNISNQYHTRAMYLLLLVVCSCLSTKAEARVAGSSSSLQPVTASLSDVVTDAIGTRESSKMNTLPGSGMQLRKHLREEPHIALQDPDGQITGQTQRKEPTDPMSARQSGGDLEDDAECEMHIDKLASLMMKRNIGVQKIKASEKKELLSNGWHKVDPEQPGAVKIVCGEKESHLGLADHCLLWKDGEPTLKKEEEVAALMRTEYMNKDKGPGVQKVSCDYLRVFYIGPRPKPPPEPKKPPKDDSQKLPFNIGGIDWSKKFPPGMKVVGMKLKTGGQSGEETKEKGDKGSDVVASTRPGGHKRKCD